MNERLKELEKQSVIYQEDEEYWDFDRQINKRNRKQNHLILTRTPDSIIILVSLNCKGTKCLKKSQQS